jgi:hypothetical protein
MANPNIANVVSILGKTAVASLITNTANIITNSAGSNTLVKLESISIGNYSNTSVFANVMINRSSVNYFLAGQLSVPTGTTLVVLAKDTTVYLEEGDVLQANCGSNGTLSLVSSYEIIS